MDRKKFLRSGLFGFGAIIALPAVISSCSKDNDNESSDDTGNNSGDNCSLSPTETRGPFPILTPVQYVRASIIGDRTGVALLMTLTIEDQSNGCTPLANVFVDVWQCDKDGLYSQYNTQTSANYLRGRQTTDQNGKVSFISIFPGWYSGRAPHIHVEILTPEGRSLLVTQIAFPVSAYMSVYTADGYNGAPDTSNTQDSIFSNSLTGNMADSVTGNNIDGYTLLKKITVA
ncbi:dioxygenase family protein [Flavobacterium ajazii]|uniref:dioxygenase family protein n=1 Tax=Flavobacterium ajazii TaxID=2692318 RepID=UPI0013D75FAA|nr:intradiol ring-cleavage dioxygenase [Flavobacterium ajazii]